MGVVPNESRRLAHGRCATRDSVLRVRCSARDRRASRAGRTGEWESSGVRAVLDHRRRRRIARADRVGVMKRGCRKIPAAGGRGRRVLRNRGSAGGTRPQSSTTRLPEKQHVLAPRMPVVAPHCTWRSRNVKTSHRRGHAGLGGHRTELMLMEGVRSKLKCSAARGDRHPIDCATWISDSLRPVAGSVAWPREVSRKPIQPK